MSDLEDTLAFQLSALKIPFTREYKFALEHIGGGGKGMKQRLRDAGLKNWRFDFAIDDFMLAVEVEGGGWIRGGHNTGKGFASDLAKYDAAQRLGWTVYRCDGAMVKSGHALDTIEMLIEHISTRSLETI